MPALAAYAFTDNVLFYPSLLGLYAYLGVLSTRPLLYAILPGTEPGQGGTDDQLAIADGPDRR